MSAERTVVNLEAARADDWFDKVAATAPNFDQLCDAIGRRYVAFSLVAGVRITALAIDSRNREQTQVTFTIGDAGEEHTMVLPEFRKCLTQALVQEDGEVGEAPEDLDDHEAVQQYLGVRYLLLAAVFGIQAHELRLGGDEPATVVIGLGGLADEVTIPEFREVIREAVRREEQAAEPQQPFAIDLGKIPEAEAAMAAGDHDRTIQLLDPWAGPLAMLLRTPQGQNLGADAKAALAKALGLLGAAYTARTEFPTAEEVLRLGVQWVQDGEVAGRLFAQLGEVAMHQGQHGQSIGLYRRAMALGAPEAEVWGPLARCFMARDRAVATLVCVDRALEQGAQDPELQELRQSALDKLGDTYTAFRELVPEGGPEKAAASN